MHLGLINGEIEIKRGLNRLGNTIYLIHRLPGEYSAGSGTTNCAESWRVIYFFENARYGQTYNTLEKADDYFNRVTVPA